MKVLFIPHAVEHYNIGLSEELKKSTKLTLLTTRRLETKAKQIVIPNLPIPLIRRLLRKISFVTFQKSHDIIHVNTASEGLFIGNFNKMVLTEHGWPDPRLVEISERKFYEEEQRALLQLYKMGVPIVTISKYSAEMLRETYGIKVRAIIYHGLLENFISKIPRKDPKEHKILWVSRLISFKEPLVFLEALSKIRDKAKFKATIKGEGPLKVLIKNYVNKNKLNNTVSIISNRIPFREMPRLYRSHTIFVHTCSQEPFGLAVLEAMGSSLPVIVPKSGGTYEVAGDSALTFTPGDSNDLAEKLLCLMHDEDLYENLSKRSLERSKEFSWQKAAHEYLKIYKSIF